MSKLQEVRRVKKNLPYTVTSIGGAEELKVWRDGEKLKEVQWEMTKASRRQAAIDAFNRGSSSYDGQVSKTTETRKRYAKLEQENIDMFCAKPSNSAAFYGIPPKPSILTQVKNWVTDWFLSIKF